MTMPAITMISYAPNVYYYYVQEETGLINSYTVLDYSIYEV